MFVNVGISHQTAMIVQAMEIISMSRETRRTGDPGASSDDRIRRWIEQVESGSDGRVATSGSSFAQSASAASTVFADASVTAPSLAGTLAEFDMHAEGAGLDVPKQAAARQASTAANVSITGATVARWLLGRVRPHSVQRKPGNPAVPIDPAGPPAQGQRSPDDRTPAYQEFPDARRIDIRIRTLSRSALSERQDTRANHSRGD